MTDRAVCVRKGLAFYPANQEAEALLRSIKSGTEVLTSFRRPRSLKQLKLWWCLMGLLVDGDIFPSKEVASDATKIAAGHVDMFVMPDTGEAIMRPKSIAFESLSHQKFCEIFERAIEAICERWMRGVTRTALKTEIFAAIDGAARPGDRVI